MILSSKYYNYISVIHSQGGAVNFNSKTVSKVTGLSFRQIDYWDRTHFIKPSVSEAAGHGSVRLYSFNDLVQMKVAKTLLDKGISLQQIRKAITYLKKNMPEIERPLAELRFLTDGESIFVLTKDKKVIIDTLKSGQLVFSIGLGGIMEDLKGEIVALQKEREYEVTVKGRKYTVVLRPDTEDGGYWIECPSLPGCASQGDTVEEALEMIRDAITGHTEVAQGRKLHKKAS
jgi:predicted RNase H-like HicB family nuclease